MDASGRERNEVCMLFDEGLPSLLALKVRNIPLFFFSGDGVRDALSPAADVDDLFALLVCDKRFSRTELVPELLRGVIAGR